MPLLLDLLPDEVDPVDLPCSEAIVLAAERLEMVLVVATEKSERPLVFDLEPGSRCTTRAVRTTVLAPVIRTLEDTLAYLARDVARLRSLRALDSGGCSFLRFLARAR